MLFQEKQKLTNRKFSAIIYIVILLFYIILFLFTSKHNDKMVLFFIFIFTLSISIYIFEICYLKIVIDNNGILLVINCFVYLKKYYKWHEIKEFKLEKSKSLSQFGGYGIRYNFNSVTGYIFNGSFTIFIEFKNNKKIAFTTNDSEQLNLLISKKIKQCQNA